MLPANAVQYAGLGVATADQLNTNVQFVQTFAQLRDFTALNGMMVIVQGGSSAADGAQGLFYYVASGSYVDNGSSIIVPTGASTGAWLLLPPGSQSAGNFATLAVTGNATIGGTLAVTGVATFAANIVMTGTDAFVPPSGTSGQRVSTGLGALRYNTTLGYLETYSSTGWQPVLDLPGTDAVMMPDGRLTLSSGVPVMTTNITGSSGVIYTPYVGNQTPQWMGAAGWETNVFPEVSQLLSDTTNSPAAAVANSCYDMFLWYNGTTATLSRGPAWSSTTARSAGTAIARVQGFFVNSNDITNGPKAGYGVYVGTIATDPGAATVSFNPLPAAASTGPSGGAWIGVWNYYNRVPVSASAQDNKSSWTYGTATWRQSDNSANNRVTFVIGWVEDFFTATFADAASAGSASIMFGIGFNSASAPSGTVGSIYNTVGSAAGQLVSPPILGLNYLQALENAANGTSATVYGLGAIAQLTGQGHQISLNTRY